MSIIETNKIDGIGKAKDKRELMFLIADHLDWVNEYEHLTILQEKINAYLGYIETKQFNEVYPNDSFDSFVIKIHFKYQISEKCSEFINVITKQLNEFNIKIETMMI